MTFSFCFIGPQGITHFHGSAFGFCSSNTTFCCFMFLTYNMLVNKHNDFLALGFLNGVDVIGILGLLFMRSCRFNTIAASRTHLRAYWYIFFMLFKHLCSKEDLCHIDWSIPIFCTLSSRRGYCNIPLITTHCCSNVSIERTESMAVFIIRDLTHWWAWEDIMLIWKHKYYLPLGGNFFVLCN